MNEKIKKDLLEEQRKIAEEEEKPIDIGILDQIK